MKIIDLSRLSTLGKRCIISGGIVIGIATVALAVTAMSFRPVEVRAWMVYTMFGALIIGLTLIIIGTLCFRRHDDYVLPPRHRGRPRGRA